MHSIVSILEFRAVIVIVIEVWDKHIQLSGLNLMQSVGREH